MITQVKGKNDNLIENKNKLLAKLKKSRERAEDHIRHMNDGVQSRIEKTDNVIMTAKSRPTQADVKEMTKLF